MDIRAHKLLAWLPRRGARGRSGHRRLPAAAFAARHRARRIKELDINPLMVYPSGQGAMVADARMILSEK